MYNHGPYFFGVGNGHLSQRAAIIARRHGAELTNYTEPNGKKRHWFETQNLGEPFNSATARAVMTDLYTTGILLRENKDEGPE